MTEVTPATRRHPERHQGRSVERRQVACLMALYVKDSPKVSLEHALRLDQLLPTVLVFQFQ